MKVIARSSARRGRLGRVPGASCPSEQARRGPRSPRLNIGRAVGPCQTTARATAKQQRQIRSICRYGLESPGLKPFELIGLIQGLKPLLPPKCKTSYYQHLLWAQPAGPIARGDTILPTFRSCRIEATAAKGDRMTLPHSYGLALALTILTMLCWGSWQRAEDRQGLAL